MKKYPTTLEMQLMLEGARILANCIIRTQYRFIKHYAKHLQTGEVAEKCVVFHNLLLEEMVFETALDEIRDSFLLLPEQLASLESTVEATANKTRAELVAALLDDSDLVYYSMAVVLVTNFRDKVFPDAVILALTTGSIKLQQVIFRQLEERKYAAHVISGLREVASKYVRR